jgi:hypothetical protein
VNSLEVVWMRGTLMRLVSGAVGVSVIGAVLVGAGASPAAANASDGWGTVKAGTLNVRSLGPLIPLPFDYHLLPVIDKIPYGTRVHVYCTFTGGPKIDGWFQPSNVWDAIDTYVTPSGSSVGFPPPHPPHPVVADAWVDTGTMQPIAPPCP